MHTRDERGGLIAPAGPLQTRQTTATDPLSVVRDTIYTAEPLCDGRKWYYLRAHEELAEEVRYHR